MLSENPHSDLPCKEVSTHSENLIRIYKFSERYYHCYYKIHLVPVIAILHVRHRDSVGHRAAQGMAQGHRVHPGSKILPLTSKTQLNLPISIDQSRKHCPNHDAGLAHMFLYRVPLCFIKDVSTTWNVLQNRVYPVCVFATHSYVRREFLKEGDLKLPWKVFRDEAAALMLASAAWGLFPTVSGDKYWICQD